MLGLSFPSDVIKRPFTSCAVNLPVDGSIDDTIHCFIEGQPRSTGRAMLQTQLEILSEPDANPFTCTDSDVEEAYHPTLELVDSDKEGDSDIEID